MAANAEEMLPITHPSCSARDHDGGPCHAMPHIPCPRCLMVSYCDKECRKKDWEAHRAHCLTEIKHGPYAQSKIPDQKPASERETFWGAYAATDVLSLERNEGKYWDDKMNIVLAGDSGLRHLIYTVVTMPHTASPKLDVVLAEQHPVRFSRTFFCLVLLLDHVHDPVLNAEAATNLCYSTKIPEALYQHIEKVVGQSLGTVFTDVDQFYHTCPEPGTTICRATWSTPSVTMDIDLDRYQWSSVKQRLAPTTMSHHDAEILRVLDLTTNTEHLDGPLSRMTSARAAGLLKWRQDGILLPYGHPRDDFTRLNPLFFNDREGFTPGASAEPLSEWPMELLDCLENPAPNDVYGKMFYYVRTLFTRFAHRTRGMRMFIHLNQQGFHELPMFIVRNYGTILFDRIEVGDNWDSYPLDCLTGFTKMLLHEDENPYATLLAITRESVTEPLPSQFKQLVTEKELLHEPTRTILDTYAPPVGADEDVASDAILRRQLGLLMWRNWDQFSDRYLNSDNFRSVIETGSEAMGMQLKTKNRIAPKWPNRLVHGKKDIPPLRDFNRWLGWADNMPERWLEWKKTGYVVRCEDRREERRQSEPLVVSESSSGYEGEAEDTQDTQDTLDTETESEKGHTPVKETPHEHDTTENGAKTNGTKQNGTKQNGMKQNESVRSGEMTEDELAELKETLQGVEVNDMGKSKKKSKKSKKKSKSKK